MTKLNKLIISYRIILVAIILVSVNINQIILTENYNRKTIENYINTQIKPIDMCYLDLLVKGLCCIDWVKVYGDG